MDSRPAYVQAIDLWSVGCIFAELMVRRPFFPGDNYIDQLTMICDKLGKPKEDEMSFVSTEKVRPLLVCPFGTAIISALFSTLGSSS